MMKNTLIVAFSSYAGMGPYVATLINSFNPDDPVRFFFMDNENKYFANNIKEELLINARIIKKNYSRIEDIRNLVFSDNVIAKQIKDYAENNNCKNIHFITNESRIRGFIGRWNKKFNLFITVHDLEEHEANKSIHKAFKHHLLHMYLSAMVDKIPNLITNSENQFEILKIKYPHKNIYYHGFPTLITDHISNGTLVVPELRGIDKYILFFGRIEAYKGLHVLYEAWINDDYLNNHYKLVIAGSGENYIKRSERERNVIFINRYVKDEEIKDLYENAVCTVYPYISATQSGVLSLSCFFHKPIISSDVPFFRCVENNGLGFNFKNGDSTDLTKKLKKLLYGSVNDFDSQLSEYYDKNYNTLEQRQSLLKIYGYN